MRNILAFLTLAIGLVACGSNEPFDINEESDAAVSADSSSGADAASERDNTASTAPRNTCESKCGVYDKAAACQCDTECTKSGDCCGDYQSLCVSTSCVDGDGDGYCDSAPKQGDCNDKDKNINPGMPEKCKDDGTGNGVDENCNGQTDEGCKVAPNPTPTGYNTLTVTYSDSGNRRLSYGITPDTSFDDWKPQAWTMNAALTVDLGNPQQGNCFYLRFNVDQPQGWLCMGNTTPVLNSQAVISANLFGKTYNTSDVKKVTKDGGCSAYILVAKPGASCQTP